MHRFKTTYRRWIRGFTLALLFLFGIHFLSIHSVVDNLVYCFEENGEINIESEAGSILMIPSEDFIHAQDLHTHNTPTFSRAANSHHDVALSQICSKEQRVTRFDQERTLKFLNGILNNKVENLPQSRVFQLVSYSPPLIEDTITASLKTVVRILYN